jgi:hypothetical protein
MLFELWRNSTSQTLLLNLKINPPIVLRKLKSKFHENDDKEINNIYRKL